VIEKIIGKKFVEHCEISTAARERTSGENLLVCLLMAPPPQELEPPANPERFTSSQMAFQYSQHRNPLGGATVTSNRT
jgi:hypothetical protein